MATGSEVHKATVLAAGERIRLRLLTVGILKVLLPIGAEKPLIRHTLSWPKYCCSMNEKGDSFIPPARNAERHILLLEIQGS